ncbi:hypothetical protein D3C83_14370 [compost metagenome]
MLRVSGHWVSPAEVEAALGLREALRQSQGGAVIAEIPPGRAANQWTPWALAASVLLAVTTTMVAWRGSVENGRLARELDAFQAPSTSVLTVPVDIMRSAGSVTPDVIIQKPAQGLIVLDIEVSPAVAEMSTIDFELLSDAGEPLQRWTSTVDRNRRSMVAFRSNTLPEGRMILKMSGPQGQPSDTRLIELRPPRAE